MTTSAADRAAHDTNVLPHSTGQVRSEHPRAGPTAGLRSVRWVMTADEAKLPTHRCQRTPAKAPVSTVTVSQSLADVCRRDVRPVHRLRRAHLEGEDDAGRRSNAGTPG